MGKTIKENKAKSQKLLTKVQHAMERRTSLHCALDTNVYRLFWGEAEGFPEVNIERYGSIAIFQYKPAVTEEIWRPCLQWLYQNFGWSLYCWKWDKTSKEKPHFVLGEPVEDSFEVIENGKKFWIKLSEGFSLGLFLDFREKRASLPIAPKEGTFLNLFSYTSSFSVYAAMLGYQTWSIDLSQKYLDWSKENFKLNNIPVEKHFFFKAEAQDWIKRWQKKKTLFDYIVLDPPSFSNSKKGPFSVKQHLPSLVYDTCALLKTESTLQVSTNLEKWKRQEFLQALREAIRETGRKILSEEWFLPAFDFPMDRKQNFYLKCLSFRLK